MAQTVLQVTDPLNPFSREAINAMFTEVYGLAPTAGENDALVGTSGTASSTNRFVTDADPRNTNTRVPTEHTHLVAELGAGTPASGKYLDGAGAWTTLPISLPADAAVATKGISKLSVAPATSTNPIAAGTNDGRIPTQGENDALEGTNGTPSSSNLFVTNSDTRNTNARAPTAHTHLVADLGTGTAAAGKYLDGSGVWTVLSTIEQNFQTGTAYTLLLADAGKVVEMNNAAANTLTVPPNSSVAFAVGTVIEVYQNGAGATTVAAGSGVTVRNAGVLRARYASASLRKRASDEWVLGGDLL